MFRRNFLTLPAAGAIGAAEQAPQYRTVTPYQASGNPNPYPGRVVAAPVSESAESVRQAIAESMKRLTGEANALSAWKQFFSPSDVVAIKVNCSGAPKIKSHPLIVWEVARCLTEAGVAPRNIVLYERFNDQVESVSYATNLPAGARIHTMEDGLRRGVIKEYDPRVFVETDFFGEEETRSFLARLVTRQVTKIINVPNMKDHGAAGVTGCLKNIAYGSFSNVARSHRGTRTNTLTMIGTLYNTEPLRSKTVLHVMDGIRGVWHGGPFVKKDRYLFEPKRLMVGTDPVAMDRLLIDIIEAKRKAEGAVSVWDRSPETIAARPDADNPNQNAFYREPGHIEFAGKLGLGVYDKQRIRLDEVLS
jgi:uncharacterized protein (DUF362 family)